MIASDFQLDSGPGDGWWARWQAFSRAMPELAIAGACFAALSVLILLPMLVDHRQWQGVGTWVKPWKFDVSIALLLLTMAGYAAAISPAGRERRSTRVWCRVGIGCAVFEAAYITLMAGLQRGSHFNVGTPLTAAIYPLMGVGALMLTASAGAIGVQIMRFPRAGLAPALRWGLGLALALGAVLGIMTGGIMAQHPNHWVGGLQTDAGGLPFFGWSRTGGDLRVAHFVGLHAMQGIALIAWRLHRRADSIAGQRRAVAATLAVGIGWTFVTLLLLRQALVGLPLWGG